VQTYCVTSSSSTAYIPDGVEDIERIVELGLLRVVLNGEEARVAEVDPGDNSQTKDSIARWTLVDIQHQTRVEELSTTNTVNQTLTRYIRHQTRVKELSTTNMVHQTLTRYTQHQTRVKKLSTTNTVNHTLTRYIQQKTRVKELSTTNTVNHTLTRYIQQQTRVKELSTTYMVNQLQAE